MIATVSDNMTEIKNVSFKYIKQEDFAVNHFSAQIIKNEITALLGPNGAGKTTLIHLICGLIQPIDGEIYHSGSEIVNNSEIKKNIGFVPQQDGLFPDLTLKENLIYFGRLYGIDFIELKQKIRELSEKMHLTNHLNKQIKHFSGGMNRRANIITGLLHDPALIILDEPTAGVDIQSRALIHEVIKELKTNNKTILYTSHLLSEAEQLCNQFIIMDHGQKILDTNRNDLVTMGHGLSLEEYFISITGQKVRD